MLYLKRGSIADSVLTRMHGFQKRLDLTPDDYAARRKTLQSNGRARRDEDVGGGIKERELEEDSSGLRAR